jgi:hypothetical protein
MRNDATAILVLAIFVAACDDEPPTAGPPADLRTISVRIDGPAQVTVPAAVQFTAVQTWFDGSMQDVTARAQWTSSNPAVLSVNAGFATALAGGEVGLTAQLDGLTSQPKSVRVMSLVSEWDGIYTLTVGGGACNESLPLPPELRQRTYTASVQQSGLFLAGEVQRVGGFGGHILNPQVRFTFDTTGQPAGRRVRQASAREIVPGGIQLVSYRKAAYSSSPGFTERLPNSTHLVVSGEAITTISSSGFTGTLNGALWLYGGSRHDLLGVCRSSSHGFSLVRR